MIVYKHTQKRLGTLHVTAQDEEELRDDPGFCDAVPVDGPIPDGFIGLLSCGRFFTWVVVDEGAE